MDYNNNKNRDEEKVFSVTMTEEELSLFSEFLEQREFNSKAQKALRKAWESREGIKAGVKRVVSENFKTVNRPERNIIRENREAVRSLFGPRKREGNIKGVYKQMNIHEKINLRDRLVNPKSNPRKVSRLQRDHGINIESPGKLSSGRDMGYGNREWNIFRASSGHGYGDTW